VALAESGFDIVVCDNFSNSSITSINLLEKIIGRKISLLECDIRDTVRVTAELIAHQCQAVLHFAGLKAVGDSVDNPIDYYANNVQGTISLLQAMRTADVKKLVFSSSATVYGEPQYLPYSEAHPTNAINPYGRTKLHIEQMLGDAAAADPTWRITSLRYFNPVGAHESGLIGDNPTGHPNNLMPYIARVASGLLPEVRVFGADYPTADGSGVRDYIHVMDLAEGHVAALEYLNNRPGYHVFNLGTGCGTSVFEIIRAFEQASGKAIPYTIVARRQGDLPCYYADVARAKTHLSWQAFRTLIDMCESSWRFQSRLDSENSL
jgi:UDP-glucose 4-epimerase